MSFDMPCLVIAPANVHHAHAVEEGEVCFWQWLYIAPQTLLTSPNLKERRRPAVSGSTCRRKRETAVTSLIAAIRQCIIQEGKQDQSDER